MKLFESVRNWGSIRGLKDDSVQMKYQRFLQEAVEIHEALVLEDEDEFIDAIGDTIVTLIMLAKAKGYKAEDCLTQAFSVIKHRKGITENGQFIRYGKLSPIDQLICDEKQGTPGSEYFRKGLDEVFNPNDFKR